MSGSCSPARAGLRAAGVLMLLAAGLGTAGDAAGQDEAPNPLLREWTTPYGIPPFDTIRTAHFRPALESALAARREQLDAIREQPQPPDFENTVEALELSGSLLTRVHGVFANLTNTDTNPALDALDVEMTAALARLRDAIYLDPKLYARVAVVHARLADSGLSSDEARLVELLHRDFVRAGAALDATARERLAAINARIAELDTVFGQNVLKATKAFTLRITDGSKLAGLPAGTVAAARAAAVEAGYPGSWVFGLNRSIFEDFMTFADDRGLRRRMYQGYRERGQESAADNRDVLLEIARLRARRAELLGYDSHAEWELQARMAGTPERARTLLLTAWPAALQRAEQEREAMQAIAAQADSGVELAAWDWWYYAEKLRQRRYALEEAQLKPYFELESVRRGAFHVAGLLFGVRFEQLHDVPTWHPTVKAWAAYGPGDEFLGVFMADDFARASKRGGAWKSTYRDAARVDGRRIHPIVTNNLNLPPPGEGQPTLLGFDQVETLFHEFGHALHELLSTVPYASFSGSRGSPRDYTEFPSQFLERYAAQPGVLAVYARHHETGEPIPAEWAKRLQRATRHNQGFRTTEFIAAALLDFAWHGLGPAEAEAVDDPLVFEAGVLEGIGLPPEIGPRYRSTYFAHVFSGGYAAGYYGYLWSEVLAADAFAAFEAAGDVFDPALAARLRDHVFAAGGRADADVLYRNFLGRDASIGPLLRERGLIGTDAVPEEVPPGAASAAVQPARQHRVGIEVR